MRFSNLAILSALLLVGLSAAATSKQYAAAADGTQPGAGQMVLSSTTIAFECSAPKDEEGWSYQPAYSTYECNGLQLVGRYANGGIGRLLPDLNVHNSVFIRFQLATIDNWQGQSIRVTADDNVVFTKSIESGNRANMCGGDSGDNIESVSFKFAHTALSMTLQIDSTLEGSVDTASWGICNLEIYFNLCPVDRWYNGKECAEACFKNQTEIPEMRACEVIPGSEETAEEEVPAVHVEEVPEVIIPVEPVVVPVEPVIVPEEPVVVVVPEEETIEAVVEEETAEIIVIPAEPVVVPVEPVVVPVEPIVIEVEEEAPEVIVPEVQNNTVVIDNSTDWIDAEVIEIPEEEPTVIVPEVQNNTVIVPEVQNHTVVVDNSTEWIDAEVVEVPEEEPTVVVNPTIPVIPFVPTVVVDPIPIALPAITIDIVYNYTYHVQSLNGANVVVSTEAQEPVVTINGGKVNANAAAAVIQPQIEAVVAAPEPQTIVINGNDLLSQGLNYASNLLNFQQSNNKNLRKRS